MASAPRPITRWKWSPLQSPTNTPVGVPASRSGAQPGVLQRLPGHLQQQALLRVHGLRPRAGRCRRRRRRSRPRGRGSRPCGWRCGPARRGRGRSRRRRPSGPAGTSRMASPAAREQLPEALRVVGAAREAAAHARRWRSARGPSPRPPRAARAAPAPAAPGASGESLPIRSRKSLTSHPPPCHPGRQLPLHFLVREVLDGAHQPGAGRRLRRRLLGRRGRVAPQHLDQQVLGERLDGRVVEQQRGREASAPSAVPSVLRSSTASSESRPSSPSGVRGSTARDRVEAQRAQGALAHEGLHQLAPAPARLLRQLLAEVGGRAAPAAAAGAEVAGLDPDPAGSGLTATSARKGEGLAWPAR